MELLEIDKTERHRFGHEIFQNIDSFYAMV